MQIFDISTSTGRHLPRPGDPALPAQPRPVEGRAQPGNPAAGQRRQAQVRLLRDAARQQPKQSTDISKQPRLPHGFRASEASSSLRHEVRYILKGSSDSFTNKLIFKQGDSHRDKSLFLRQVELGPEHRPHEGASAPAKRQRGTGCPAGPGLLPERGRPQRVPHAASEAASPTTAAAAEIQFPYVPAAAQS